MLFNQNYLYSFVELQKLGLVPIRQTILGMQKLFPNSPSSTAYYSDFSKNYKAIFHVLERLTATYNNKSFGIESTVVNGKTVKVAEKIIIQKPFCNLIHFEKGNKKITQKKLLIVAPLSGHHASLLTDSVAAMLPFFDVYITNWSNAADVPLKQGSFDMDDYIDYTIEFIKHLGENISAMAISQSTVPLLAATSILASQEDEHVPNSLILMSGPIDARINQTKVNQFAGSHDIKWFNDYLITQIPANYPGSMRRVYPGFLQLSFFLSSGMQKQLQSYTNLYHDSLNNDIEELEKNKNFHDRYLSVIDLPAEFYLQTVKEIFQEHSMAKGQMSSRGRKIDLSLIKNTALLCIEGQNDDITGIGQTKAALTLCNNLADEKKHYHLEPNVGHYGIFSGGRFKRNIAPLIIEFAGAR